VSVRPDRYRLQCRGGLPASYGARTVSNLRDRALNGRAGHYARVMSIAMPSTKVAAVGTVPPAHPAYVLNLRTRNL